MKGSRATRQLGISSVLWEGQAAMYPNDAHFRFGHYTHRVFFRIREGE